MCPPLPYTSTLSCPNPFKTHTITRAHTHTIPKLIAYSHPHSDHSLTHGRAWPHIPTHSRAYPPIPSCAYPHTTPQHHTHTTPPTPHHTIPPTSYHTTLHHTAPHHTTTTPQPHYTHTTPHHTTPRRAEPRHPTPLQVDAATIIGSRLFRVVHSPKVAVRDRASTTSNLVGLKMEGECVLVSRDPEQAGWLRLADRGFGHRQEWMLRDGASLGFGVLLEEVLYQPLF